MKEKKVKFVDFVRILSAAMAANAGVFKDNPEAMFDAPMISRRAGSAIIALEIGPFKWDWSEFRYCSRVRMCNAHSEIYAYVDDIQASAIRAMLAGAHEGFSMAAEKNNQAIANIISA